MNYVLDYRNETGADVSHLRIEFTYPEGFTPKRFTPNPSAGQKIWNIPLLRQGSGSRITVTGTLTGNERETKPVSVTVKRQINQEYVNYERASASSVISSPLLSAQVLVNGSRDYTATLGDAVIYSIQYRNSSNFNLLGMTLTAKLEGDMFDLSSLDANGGFFDSSANTILWNASSVPNFGNLAPGAGGVVEFRVRMKPNFPSGIGGAKNFFVKTTATLSTPNVPTGIDSNEVATQDSLVTKISTQPVLHQVMYYNDPAFGSSGPMPPQVGTETAFTVHWQLINPGNDMNDAVIRATLPAGITWKNVVSTGASQPQPVFDRNKSEVVWNLNLLPNGVGVISAKYEVSFQVSITPSLTQRNNTPTIVKIATLSGIDAFTRQQIVVTSRELSTNDTSDRSGEGVVK